MRRFFAARPRLAAVVALAIALVGVYAASVVGLSDYPELAPTIVGVSTSYSGASPTVIADTVATPIEDQINSVENVYFFDSRCSDSGSYELFVTFLPGTDPDMNLVKVQNAVKRAEPKLPSEVLQVGLAISKCSSDYAIQFLFTTDGGEMDLVALGNFVNHEIKDALQRVRGVSSVSCSDNEYAMRVWLDTMKMDALGISVVDVRSAISGQNIQPAAGFVGNAMSSPYLSYKVNAPGRLVTAAEFEAIVVRTDPATGARVLLGDIARCELGSKSYTQEPRMNGRLCYSVSAYADSEANTREVARVCRAAVDEWMKRAPKGVAYSVLHDQSDYIDALMSNFGLALAMVCALSLLVFACCAGLRRAAVAAVVVCVSQLCGMILLCATGWTLDAITVFAFLAGLAVALAIAAGGAAGVITLLIVAAFSPLAMYGGMTGAMFVRFAAVSAVIAAGASLLAAMFPNLPLCGLETVEDLKIEFYEPSGPFQKYIYMDGGPANVFILAPQSQPTGCSRPYSGFPTPLGCSQLELGLSEQGASRLPCPGGLPSPWPWTAFFVPDSLLLLMRNQPLQSPQPTGRCHQLL